MTTIPTERSNRGSRRKGVIRRQQIVDYTREVLISHGVAGLVLRDVAEKVGITHGNLQYYFAAKEDLIVAVFEQELLKYTKSMHEALVQATSRSARISAIIDSGVHELRSEATELWLMLHSLARQNESLRTILAETNRQYDETLAEHLSLIDPDLGPARRRHIAILIRMMLDGFAVEATCSGLDNPATIALQGEMKAAINQWFGSN